jgi:hypothetical protein
MRTHGQLAAERTGWLPGLPLSGLHAYLDGGHRGLEPQADVPHPSEALRLLVQQLLVAQEHRLLLLESLLSLQYG